MRSARMNRKILVKDYRPRGKSYMPSLLAWRSLSFAISKIGRTV